MSTLYGEKPPKKAKKIKVTVPSSNSNVKAVDSINQKEFGSLRITTLQLPEVKQWKVGQEYNLNVKVRMTGVDERQDTKYDDKQGKSTPIGSPYFEGDFRITDINTSAAKEENAENE